MRIDLHNTLYSIRDLNVFSFIIVLLSLNLNAQQTNNEVNSLNVTDSIYSDWPDLLYATYWGGADDDDEAENMVIDNDGNIIVAGQTKSEDLPVTGGAFQSVIGGERDVLVAKYGPDNSLLWATYIGGDSSEYAYGLAVDADLNIYVSGTTNSLDFPVLNAFQDTLYDDWDGILMKFSPDGDLLWSTYFGGNDDEYVNGVAVDEEGRVYITGETESDEFHITAGAFQTEMTGDNICFISRFSSNGDLIWSTYFGGNTEENGNDIIVDQDQDIFVIGEAYSPDCPLSGGFYQDTVAGNDDALLLKMDSLGTLIFATVIGGTDDDDGRKVQLDGEDNIYIIGDLISTDFPTTPGAFQSELGGEHDAFVSKFDNDGNLLWSTYLGGDSSEYVYGIDVDQYGTVYVYGETPSPNFPVTTEAYQTTLSSPDDMFISTFDDVGNVLWSTYFGGDGDDDAAELRFKDGKLYIVGTSESTDMPITSDAIQPDLAQWEDVYIAIFEYTEVAVGIPVLNKVDFPLYPVPASDLVFVGLTDISYNNLRVDIYDVSGSLVHSEKIISGDQELIIDLGHLPPGAYNLSLFTDQILLANKKLMMQ